MRQPTGGADCTCKQDLPRKEGLQWGRKKKKRHKREQDKHRQPETKKKEVLQSSVYIPQPPRRRLSERASEGATLALTRSASGAPGGRWCLEQNRYSESLLSPSAARETRSVVAGKRERKADTCAAIRGSGGGGVGLTVSRKTRTHGVGWWYRGLLPPKAEGRCGLLDWRASQPQHFSFTRRHRMRLLEKGGCQLRAATKANGASWSLLVLDHCWDFKNSSFLLLCERQSIESASSRRTSGKKKKKRALKVFIPCLVLFSNTQNKSFLCFV